MVRVMHHLVDVPAALLELHRVTEPGGTAVIEHASKLNLKAIARWMLGRQQWRPFDFEPVEFVELNFNFHPAWMRQQFENAGFRISGVRTLSHYRIDALKRLLPTSLLVTLDGWAQETGNLWQLTPSVFLQADASKPDAHVAPGGVFRCPACKSPHLTITRQSSPAEYILTCQACNSGWQFKNGIYDFKTPIKAPDAAV
jgi:hypothetical protein